MSRVPVSCPTGFMGRYTVTSGDSMFRIAQLFRIPLQSLVTANPHIRVPSEIFPGDILCVPGLVPFPCSLVLQRQLDLATGTEASALVHLSTQGTLSVSVVAVLPPPSTFGNFDMYIATVLIPEIDGGFGNQLFPTPADPPTYSTTLSFPTVAQLTPASTIEVRPSNSTTGIDGPVLLRGRLQDCCRTTQLNSSGARSKKRKGRLRSRRRKTHRACQRS